MRCGRYWKIYSSCSPSCGPDLAEEEEEEEEEEGGGTYCSCRTNFSPAKGEGNESRFAPICFGGGFSWGEFLFWWLHCAVGLVEA